MKNVLPKILEIASSLTTCSWNENNLKVGLFKYFLCESGSTSLSFEAKNVTNVDKILIKVIHNGLSLTSYIIIY